MEDPFEGLNQLALWDFEVRTYSSLDALGEHNLLVVGSRDFCYYHDAEVRFFEVAYLSLPSRFHHARFRLATAHEEMLVRQRAGDVTGQVFCIVEEHDGPDAHAHFIVAARVAIRLETVRYRPG